MADADIIKAKQRIDKEKLVGFTLGAKNGMTLEVAEVIT